ncbi:hypothetical protein M3Y96_01186700 [Aphelenchoides besseyi]|nr:hypothetical protein M3Y96_01186700 [Aphelenchoides besseyi]
MTYQIGCYRSNGLPAYRAKCVSVSRSRTSITSRDPKILAEINKLERDLFGFAGDRLQQKPKKSSFDETDVSMPTTEKLSTTDDTKTRTDGLVTTSGSSVCSSTTKPKSVSKMKNVKTAILPIRSLAKAPQSKPKAEIGKSRQIYGTWQSENELKLTLKSLLNTINHFRSLHFLAPQSTAAEVNSLIATYNELKAKYNACGQQRQKMAQKLRDLKDENLRTFSCNLLIDLIVLALPLVPQPTVPAPK